MLASIPVIDDQVDALRDMTTSASTLGHAGKAAADRVNVALDAAKHDAHSRVVLIDTVISSLSDVEQQVQTIQVGAKGWLLPPLASARQQLVDKLAEVPSKIGDALRLSRAMRTFLAGPSKYLVLGGNNAEMRALGIATTSGVSMVKDGSISVSDFYDVNVVNISPPGVTIPDDVRALYGWLNPDLGYENAVMTPNFPVAADIASRISDINPIGPVDGVLYTDTYTLQGLLSVVGPVTVAGVTYDGTNAASELINQNYLTYPTGEQSPERRKGNSDVAKAIFDAVNTRSYSITRLAAMLSDLAKGRHLNAWAKDPAVNELWQKIGADGATAPDDFVITSQELGASKLDYYVRIQAKLSVRDVGDARRLSLDVTIDNPTKDGPLSPYILGGSIYANPGEYGTFLTVSMPKQATDLVYPAPVARLGPDGPLQVVAIADRVPPGQPKTEHFELTLPKSVRNITIVPSARLVPVSWDVNGQTFDDTLPKTIDLTTLPEPPGPAEPLWYLTAGMVAIGLAILFSGAAAIDRDDEVSGTLARVGTSGAFYLAAVGTALLVAQIAANLVR